MKIRFGIAIVVVTLACLGQLFHIDNALAGCMIAFLLILDPAELNQPIPRKEILILFNSFIVFLVILFAIIYFTSRVTRDMVHSIISHPIFVLFWWLFWMYVIYRAWQRQKEPTVF
ncbi:MAG: hypothetical protein ACE14V_01965 [bacterium]